MHITPKSLPEYPWYIRLFFWKQQRTYGKILDPGLLWGRSPLVFAGVALLYGAINRKRSPIEPSLRSLLTVCVSQINHCAFCIDINAETLLKRGVCEEKVTALATWRDSDLFSKRERTALAYAEAITFTEGVVTAELMKQLKAEFNEDAIAELTGLIAFQNLSSKFNSALDVPPQGFCRILPPANRN
ncbi:MAG: carboxymuconolactone decarboxylase family protein [Gammaproteobacteria bacterium]|nr:carboxymuconolactone decarboxylase family protein [Gammaproteobacteria bacterium]